MTSEKEYVDAMLHRTSLCFTQDEIEKVKAATVSIAGLGGVGAITAELLARWGVKNFRLLDMDCYEASNLNRQLFATSKTIGESKVAITAQRILEINPHANIQMAIDSRVDNENVNPFVKGADIIIQNADHPSCKLFYLAARKHKVPLVNGYATITGGMVQTFNYKISECTSVFDSLWNKIKFGDSKPLDKMNTDEIIEFDRQNVHQTAPSVNFVVNTVGCMIVGEAVKLLTQRGKVVQYPKFMKFDLFDHRMSTGHSIYNFEVFKNVVKKIISKL